MEITEIRDLDGPNLFLPSPAIKLEVASEDGDWHIRKGEERVRSAPDEVMSALKEELIHYHRAVGQPEPVFAVRELETPHHLAIAFTWSHRRFAKQVAKSAANRVLGLSLERVLDTDGLRALLDSEPDDDDAPEMIPTASRSIPCVTVTGTNGKTTTSRLIAHVLRGLGKRVGLTSSAGVYIDQQMVLEGDYSGPAGAQRVYKGDEIDIAVLETARGGMLLRGLGVESSDVGVVTNVSADHLGLHGILTIEGLAEVKSLVARYVRPEGRVVLNADDPLVLAMRDVAGAPVCLTTRKGLTDDVRQHIERGEWAIVADDNIVTWYHDGTLEQLTTLEDIPITFGGKAPHNVENALSAAAALLGLGVDPAEVREGLRQFSSSSSHNRGRLNVYELNGGTIVIDFAHNEAGLAQLLAFANNFLGEGGTLTAVIGTAGDRDDDVFRSIGRVAAEKSDAVVLKDSHKYLRGRDMGDMPALMREGVESAGKDVDITEAESERDACMVTFDGISPGDVVAVMCIEDFDFILPWLEENGDALG